MGTDSGTEEYNIYHNLFMWILDKYGKHLHVNNVLNITYIQNPLTEKCSSPHFQTVGYFYYDSVLSGHCDLLIFLMLELHLVFWNFNISDLGLN